MTKLKEIDDVLLKIPFKRVSPVVNWYPKLTSGEAQSVTIPKNFFYVIDQRQYLAEYDPNGHKINDPTYYADKTKKAEDGRFYTQFVERCSFPFQSEIVTRQLTHLGGNGIQFVNAEAVPTDDQEMSLTKFKQAWLGKNMEVALHESFKMEKITGDAAFCAYLDNNVLGWRVFGFNNGEILYPQFDNKTGKLIQLARKYYQSGDGGALVEYVDLWDDVNLTTYTQDISFMGKIKKTVGMSQWALVSKGKHGFNRIPIAYKRSAIGACWSLVQDAIYKYEMSVSQLCENNKFYAFRIMFVKGTDVDISADVSGSPLVITGDENSDAKFMEKADASSSFELQLKILLQNIFMGSFTVLPPEVKGGDLPGVTIKLLYSPAVEKAMEDAMDWNSFVDDVVSIFKYGIGIEEENLAEYNTLKVRGEIIPYVHQNNMEIATILNQGVTMGSISIETASHIYPMAANNEFERLTAQAEKKQAIQDKANQTKLDATMAMKSQQMSSQANQPLNENNQNRQNAGI